jgi:hypothetical protein
MEKDDRELERRWQLRWRPIIFGVVAIAFLIVLFNLERIGGPLKAFKANATDLAQLTTLEALKKPDSDPHGLADRFRQLLIAGRRQGPDVRTRLRCHPLCRAKDPPQIRAAFHRRCHSQPS